MSYLSLFISALKTWFKQVGACNLLLYKDIFIEGFKNESYTTDYKTNFFPVFVFEKSPHPSWHN